MAESTGLPINEENLLRMTDGIAAVAPFMERRATELGESVRRSIEAMAATGISGDEAAAAFEESKRSGAMKALADDGVVLALLNGTAK